jgi:hypothetical protein
MASTEVYGADSEPPIIPSRFTCVVIRALYRHYNKQYSVDQMLGYLRSKNISEDRIAEAEKCIK